MEDLTKEPEEELDLTLYDEAQLLLQELEDE